MRVFSLLSSLLATEALPGSQSARRSNVIIAPPLEWASRSDRRDAAKYQFDRTESWISIQDRAHKMPAEAFTHFAVDQDDKSRYPENVWKAAGAMRRCEICMSEETASTGIGRLEAAWRRMSARLHVAKQFIGGTGYNDYLVEHLRRDIRVRAIVERAAQVIRKIMDRDLHHQ